MPATAIAAPRPLYAKPFLRRSSAFGMSDTGRCREQNEDSFWVGEDMDVHVVADGIGGHAGGEVASQLAIDTIERHLRKKWRWRRLSRGEGRGEMLASAIRLANYKVWETALDVPELHGMGTTMAAIAIDRTSVAIAHVGDSRVYRWRADEGLVPMTRDHSLLNALIDSGEVLTPEEIYAFPKRHVIVRSVGTRPAVEPDVETISKRNGDVFLLCSDGLTDMVEDEVIEDIIRTYRHDLVAAGRALVDMANQCGGRDNITAVLVRVEDGPEAAA